MSISLVGGGTLFRVFFFLMRLGRVLLMSNVARRLSFFMFIPLVSLYMMTVFERLFIPRPTGRLDGPHLLCHDKKRCLGRFVSFARTGALCCVSVRGYGRPVLLKPMV